MDGGNNLCPSVTRIAPSYTTLSTDTADAVDDIMWLRFDFSSSGCITDEATMVLPTPSQIWELVHLVKKVGDHWLGDLLCQSVFSILQDMGININNCSGPHYNNPANKSSIYITVAYKHACTLNSLGVNLKVKNFECFFQILLSFLWIMNQHKARHKISTTLHVVELDLCNKIRLKSPLSQPMGWLLKI